jgi:VIT1/CCC1 family predicted Fe2+/Mn2+ transporter
MSVQVRVTIGPAGAAPVPAFEPNDLGIPAGPAAFVRDVILGGQDGLVNVLGLVLGMAAATGSTHVVVTAGLAALLAESIAMAGVAFTSSGAERQLAIANESIIQSQRTSLRHVQTVRRQERMLENEVPEAVRRLTEVEAQHEADAWLARLDEERAALRPVREARPLRAAAIVGVSTAIGSSVPLLPFVLLPIGIAPIAALAAAAFVLGIAGIERAALTGGGKGRAALEMLGIGLVSAFAGYVIGVLLRSPGA